MNKISLAQIFRVFFKIGVILLGGGYVIIPIMKDELVIKRNWIEENELYDFYCVSQCLPGIIAVNMAILTGFRLSKFKGALTSLFAMALSPFITIIIIANIVNKIADYPFLDKIFWAINISVIVLIYLTIKDIFKKSLCDLFSVIWFLLIITLSLFKVNPAFLIVVSFITGIFIAVFNKKGISKDE